MNKAGHFTRAGVFNVLVSGGLLFLSFNTAFVKFIPILTFLKCFYLFFNFIEE